MRRVMIVAVVALSTVLITSQFSTRNEASAHSGYWRVSDEAGNGLRLRTGPSGDYRIIEVMSRGDRLKAFGHRGNWIKVRHLATGSVGWAFLTYVVADSAPATGGGGSTSGLPRCYPNSWGQVFCASEDEANAAWSAAVHWGASYWWLMSIASCESNFYQFAYNGITGVSGILQFLPSTFYGFGGSNLWSYWEQFYVAARMYVQGYAWMWDCNWRI